MLFTKQAEFVHIVSWVCFCVFHLKAYENSIILLSSKCMSAFGGKNHIQAKKLLQNKNVFIRNSFAALPYNNGSRPMTKCLQSPSSRVIKGDMALPGLRGLDHRVPQTNVSRQIQAVF